MRGTDAHRCGKPSEPAPRGLTPVNPAAGSPRIVTSSGTDAGGRAPDEEDAGMAPTRRRTTTAAKPVRRTPTIPAEGFVEPLEIDEDASAEALREATMLLDVPEWVDPETGELADDELHRYEDH